MSNPNSAAAELTLQDINVGEAFELTRTFTREDVDAFARVSGDFSPLHVDPTYAATTEFGECVVHGILLASLFSQLVGMRIPGKPALYLGQDLSFRRPVLVGQPVKVVARVTGKSDSLSTITLSTEIRGADNQIAVSGNAKVKVRGQTIRANVSSPAAVTKSAQQRVALITGGSRGLGAEVARTLAASGCAVAINYFRNKDQAQQVAASIAAAGGTAIAVQADVRDAEQVADMHLQITNQLGSPTVIVNAATAELTQGAVATLGWDQFLLHLEYQVKGVLQVCKAAHAGMKASGGGSIVNILSQTVHGAPAANMSDYVTAKCALAGLSRSLAVEWAADGIRVNTISPSLLQTDLTQHYHERIFRSEAARTPLRRIATLRDVAQGIAYLTSDAASFLTGIDLPVTGGQVMT